MDREPTLADVLNTSRGKLTMAAYTWCLMHRYDIQQEFFKTTSYGTKADEWEKRQEYINGNLHWGYYAFTDWIGQHFAMGLGKSFANVLMDQIDTYTLYSLIGEAFVAEMSREYYKECDEVRQGVWDLECERRRLAIAVSAIASNRANQEEVEEEEDYEDLPF